MKQEQEIRKQGQVVFTKDQSRHLEMSGRIAGDRMDTARQSIRDQQVLVVNKSRWEGKSHL